MPRTSTTCPRCRQPIVADIQQLFDLSQDPAAKQRLLSGIVNIARCTHCGYEGALATPVVYHDPEKELLLTYFPPELGLPVNEQERQIGPLINQVVNRLPPEKRKAYLLRPQSMLTFQTLIEKILEGEGITREMIQAQQQRLNLIQRLLDTPPDRLAEVIAKEEALIDQDFFTILSRLAEASLAQGDEQTARALAALQQELLSKTKFGQEVKLQAEEAEAAIKSLQEAGQQGLTREKLLDLIINAPTESRLNALVSLARSGMDYVFFQVLSERIEKAQGEEKQKLSDLREKLLELVSEIDKLLQEQVEEAQKLLDKILAAPNIEEATLQNLNVINTPFVDLLRAEIDKARKNGNLEQSAKLQQVMSTLQKASAPPPEIAFIQELLSAGDDATRQKMLEDRAAEITPGFLEMLNNVVAQSEAQNQPPKVIEELQKVYRSVLRFSMKSNLTKSAS